MNAGGLSFRVVLEALAGLLENRLRASQQGPNLPSARLVLFPKRVHEMGLHEGQAPDGLSAAYARLASDLNAAATTDQTGPASAEHLLRSIEHVVATATTHERALVALLQKS